MIQSKNYQANPTIPPTTTALTWIFNAQDTATTNNVALTIPAIIVCFAALLLLIVFQHQHCLIRHQDMLLFQRKGD
jgi:hypothetical protein